MLATRLRYVHVLPTEAIAVSATIKRLLLSPVDDRFSQYSAQQIVPKIFPVEYV